MNRIQRFTIAAGVVVLVTLCLFPPWKILGHQGAYSYQFEKFIGYHFLSPPPLNGIIDIKRLIAIAGIIIIAGSGLVWVFKDKKK